MVPFLYCGCAAGLAVVVTGLICRWQLARHKRVAITVALPGALIATVVSVIGITGPSVLTADFWSGNSKMRHGIGLILSIMATLCAAASLAAVAFCRQRQRHGKEGA